MNTRYYIGLDLGKKHDFSAVAVVERRTEGVQNFLNPWYAPTTTYDLRHIERIPLGTPYPRVVSRVGAIVARQEMRGRATLIVDATGAGEPVVDLLRQANFDCPFVPVTITGGDREHRIPGGRSVPKRDLIATLEIVLQEGELRIAANLPNSARSIPRRV